MCVTASAYRINSVPSKDMRAKVELQLFGVSQSVPPPHPSPHPIIVCAKGALSASASCCWWGWNRTDLC